MGATENVLSAAVLASGRTRLSNAAREPEIVDIAEMLTEMGACITGAGTSVIEVEGVAELKAGRPRRRARPHRGRHLGVRRRDHPR